jgi:hypothetical protein
VCLPRARGSYTPSLHRLKSDSYETFRASSQLCTVAAFVPVVPEAQILPPIPFTTPIKASVENLTVEVSSL